MLRCNNRATGIPTTTDRKIKQYVGWPKPIMIIDDL